MHVIYKVRRGTGTVRETELYPDADLDSVARGIQDRISDPFDPKVEAVEVRDDAGRSYDIEWSLLLMPRAA